MTQKIAAARVVRLVAAAGVLVCGGLSAAEERPRRADLQPVVYTGQPVPGGHGARFDVPPPLGLDGVQNFLISPAGRVVFGADTVSAGGGRPYWHRETSSLWAWENGRLTPIARAGDPMPGGGTFTSFSGLPDVNRPGDVAFVAAGRGTGAGAGAEGLFLASPQGRNGPYSVRTVLRTGDAVGAETVSVFSEIHPVLNDAGETSFAAGMRSQSADGGLTYLTTAGGGISTLLRAGGPDPRGAEVGAAFVYGIDRRGRTTLLPYGPAYDGGHVFHGTGGDLREVAAPGSPAPGTGGDTFYTHFGPGVSRRGVHAVTALTSRYRHGVWVGDADGVEPLALSRQPAPGVAGGEFRAFVGLMRVNERGEAAFTARINVPGRGDSVYGIWVGEPGRLEKVIVEGEALPGTDDVLGRILHPNPHLSETGDVAFLAVRNDSPYPRDNGGDGIWAGRAGRLSLVAEVGDVVRLDDGLEKTIDRLYFPYHYGGGRHATVFGDNNELLFQARFTDGTYGLLVGQVNNPEPAGALLLCAAGAACCLRRRHRRA